MPRGQRKASPLRLPSPLRSEQADRLREHAEALAAVRDADATPYTDVELLSLCRGWKFYWNCEVQSRNLASLRQRHCDWERGLTPREVERGRALLRVSSTSRRKATGNEYKGLSINLTSSKEFILTALTLHPYALKHASEVLRHDKAFVRAAIYHNVGSFKHAPAELRLCPYLACFAERLSWHNSRHGDPAALKPCVGDALVCSKRLPDRLASAAARGALGRSISTSSGLSQDSHGSAATMCRWGNGCAAIDCEFNHPTSRGFPAKEVRGRRQSSSATTPTEPPSPLGASSRDPACVRVISRCSSRSSSRSFQSGSHDAGHCVAASDLQLPPTARVAVSLVRFRHDCISESFKAGGPHGGAPISSLVDELKAGKVNVDDLILDVTEHEGNLLSFSNRRLWCLKRYAQDVGEDIGILVRVFPLVPGVRLSDGRDVMQKFRSSYTSRNSGITVDIRTASSSRSRSSSCASQSMQSRRHTPRKFRTRRPQKLQETSAFEDPEV
eukprot:TRINITY_DN41892_c0_g1_i1.p1 TRINITY_DN41892_c0_g1~~TRINITY_DN41892_c0_g1_i1.p1  ORF type:complete len:500 (-),score=43.44 TRINITY_DN41892_c0_g1_i1:427-1926(-)